MVRPEPVWPTLFLQDREPAARRKQPPLVLFATVFQDMVAIGRRNARVDARAGLRIANRNLIRARKKQKRRVGLMALSELIDLVNAR